MRPLRRHLRHTIDAGRSPWVTAREPRERSTSRPTAQSIERLVGIFEQVGR